MAKNKNKAAESSIGQFVRIIEKDKHPDIFDGVLVSQTEEGFVAICQGPKEDSPIRRQTFTAEDWLLEEREKEQVKHAFSQSILKSEGQVMDAEFDLNEARYSLNLSKAYMSEFFK